MIKQSKYFFYGSAADTLNGYVQYALYDPISSRFVLCSQFPNALYTVAKLFAGRCSLRLCCLHHASNFTPDLVDNTCCTNWTIGDVSELAVARSIETHIDGTIFNAQKIVPAQELNAPELIVDNQEFLMAIYKWCTTEEGRPWMICDADAFHRTELEFAAVVNLPLEMSAVSEDIKMMHDIIFNEFDFEKAKVQVENILGKYP